MFKFHSPFAAEEREGGRERESEDVMNLIQFDPVSQLLPGYGMVGGGILSTETSLYHHYYN